MLLGVFLVLAPGAGAAQPGTPGPPGNNGTVKLDGITLDDGPGHTQAPNDPDETEPDNDPHLDCGLQLEFFNFDEGQLADIVFTAHRSTGDGGVLLAQEDVLVSDDPTAGAANDPDAVFDYDVLEDFDLTQFTEIHDQHGWHVKLDLTLYNADGTPVPGGQKHKVFWVEDCRPETVATGALQVDKVVTGDGAPASTTEFPFTVECSTTDGAVDLNGEDEGDEATFSLTDGDEPEVIDGIPVGATCTITEDDDMGADTTTIVVGEGDPSDGTSVSDVEIGESTTEVEVTNDFDEVLIPPTGALSVDKVVTGTDTPAESTEFQITVDCLDGEDAVDLNGPDEAGTQAVFFLTDADEAETLTGIPAGATCTVTEVIGADAARTTTITVDGTSSNGTTVTGVTIADAATRVVVVRNAYAEVLGSVVTPPKPNPTPTPRPRPTSPQGPVVLPDVVTPTPAPAVLGEQVVRPQPAAAPQPEVKGAVAARGLARTGAGSDTLAAIGMVLVLFGAALTLGSRRRLQYLR